jgi:hypothetical protein
LGSVYGRPTRWACVERGTTFVRAHREECGTGVCRLRVKPVTLITSICFPGCFVRRRKLPDIGTPISGGHSFGQKTVFVKSEELQVNFGFATSAPSFWHYPPAFDGADCHVAATKQPCERAPALAAAKISYQMISRLTDAPRHPPGGIAAKPLNHPSVLGVSRDEQDRSD